MSPRRYGDPCPVTAALGSVTGKWEPAILGRLAHGPSRFGALREAVRADDGTVPTAKVLANALRRLARADLVRREASGERAPRYRLTERGETLIPVLDALGRWAVSPEAPGSDTASPEASGDA